MKSYTERKDILERADFIIDKSLRDIIPEDSINSVFEEINKAKKIKGSVGSLIEKFLYNKEPNNKSEPDFFEAGIELKTTPIKTNSNRGFTSKERLVFSMIDYNNIIKEKWESSSFLKKNKVLLLLFYLWVKDINVLDYKFKYKYLLDLLEDISDEDILQIKKDWEFIVEKIKKGEAHLLSEADTFYLGACTKGKDASVVRTQPFNDTKAKPRAFSFKQSYINYLLNTKIVNNKDFKSESILVKTKNKTINNAVYELFEKYIGKTDKEILNSIGVEVNSKSKSFKRNIVNAILVSGDKKVLELEKANITLKVITLEPNGSLRESISFPAFSYKDLIKEEWFNDDTGKMSDFHYQLETKKFLFVIFQKIRGSEDILLKKVMFWNFPNNDLEEVKKVWDKTKELVIKGDYKSLPKISESSISHVRPHAKNKKDTFETPQGTQEIKRCFWLNAKYIQNAIREK